MEETVKDRLFKFIEYLNMSVRQFEIKWGVASGYVRNISKGIGNDHLSNLCNQYPNLDLNWLLTGKGSMLKNIPENSENLTQQTITEERSNSIDELIINLVKQTVMNEIPAIIKAVGEVMQGQHAGQNEILTTYLRNQKEISELQIGIIREVVKILAESNPTKAKDIDTKIVELTKKII